MSRLQADIGKTSTGDVPYKFRGIDAVVNALNLAMVNEGQAAGTHRRWDALIAAHA
jgi:hypothetical protein